MKVFAIVSLLAAAVMASPIPEAEPADKAITFTETFTFPPFPLPTLPSFPLPSFPPLPTPSFPSLAEREEEHKSFKHHSLPPFSLPTFSFPTELPTFSFPPFPEPTL